MTEKTTDATDRGDSVVRSPLVLVYLGSRPVAKGTDKFAVSQEPAYLLCFLSSVFLSPGDSRVSDIILRISLLVVGLVATKRDLYNAGSATRLLYSRVPIFLQIKDHHRHRYVLRTRSSLFL